MADEFQISGSWWESSRNRFERGISSPSSALSSLGSFGWPPEMADMKARSSMESVSVSSSSSFVFHDVHKLQDSDSSAVDPNLQMMGLGLSSRTIDWNQSLLHGEKSEMSFRSMLQENMNSNSSFHQPSGPNQWRDRLFSGDNSSENEFKPLNRGFSLDRQEFSAHDYSGADTTATCLGLSSSFQMDSSALYGNSTTILQGFENQNQQNSNSMEFSYGANFLKSSDEFTPSSWSSSKVPQLLRALPPKQQAHHSHLHFSNNAPFWNASDAAIKETKPSFFPSLQTQFYSQNLEEKPKNISETRDSGTVIKRSGSQPNSKRPRSETPSPLPAFKVRKEKMGDRVTALQQLVSPFGKTDTASVLSEAIDYIKFLHEQVSVLSTPYMKSGTAIQHQHNLDSSKEAEGLKQDLRSRGLCLVPVSSTFPVTHESTVDFWTPTFGGTFR